MSVCDAQDGWTALMSAAYSGHMKVVELLLEKGAKTGAINNVSHWFLSWTVIVTCITCLENKRGEGTMINCNADDNAWSSS